MKSTDDLVIALATTPVAGESPAAAPAPMTLEQAVLAARAILATREKALDTNIQANTHPSRLLDYTESLVRRAHQRGDQEMVLVGRLLTCLSWHLNQR